MGQEALNPGCLVGVFAYIVIQLPIPIVWSIDRRECNQLRGHGRDVHNMTFIHTSELAMQNLVGCHTELVNKLPPSMGVLSLVQAHLLLVALDALASEDLSVPVVGRSSDRSQW